MKTDLTRNQQLVLTRLSQTNTPLGAYSLLDELRKSGFRSPLQVYRALDKLIAHGLVHRIESLNAFIACVDPACHETQLAGFAICENCGTVTEFSDPDIQQTLAIWCQANAFSATTNTLEIRGLCQHCRKH